MSLFPVLEKITLAGLLHACYNSNNVFYFQCDVHIYRETVKKKLQRLNTEALP